MRKFETATNAARALMTGGRETFPSPTMRADVWNRNFNDQVSLY
jgi:hypothetical protein